MKISGRTSLQNQEMQYKMAAIYQSILSSCMKVEYVVDVRHRTAHAYGLDYTIQIKLHRMVHETPILPMCIERVADRTPFLILINVYPRPIYINVYYAFLQFSMHSVKPFNFQCCTYMYTTVLGYLVCN